jgi:hypothetical protein
LLHGDDNHFPRLQFSRDRANGVDGSILDIMDESGNSWALRGGYGQLIELTGYKQPVGFSWGSGVSYKPAQDCS